MGFFVAQEETFASLLEWDKSCCSLGRIDTWTFQRHFRTRGSLKAFEQLSDCQLIYGPNAYDYDGVHMDLHSAVNGLTAYGVSHNQILRHLCEKPGSMENKAFKSFILLRNLTPQERAKKVSNSWWRLVSVFLSNLTRPMMFRKWTPTWMRMWDPRIFCWTQRCRPILELGGSSHDLQVVS